MSYNTSEYIPPETRIQVKTFEDRVEYTPLTLVPVRLSDTKLLLKHLGVKFETKYAWTGIWNCYGVMELKGSEAYAKEVIDKYLAIKKQIYEDQYFEKHGEITYQEYP